jgi:hypothetical protein
LSTYKFIYFFINRSAEGKKSPRWWLNGWAQSDPVQVLGTDLQSQGKAFRKAVPLGTPLAAEGSKQTPSLLLVLLQNLLDLLLGHGEVILILLQLWASICPAVYFFSSRTEAPFKK